MEKSKEQLNIEYEEAQKSGEIFPIKILIKGIKNKWSNTKTIEEKIDFIKNFNIDEEISIEFLEYLIKNEYEQKKFIEIFNNLKFSIIYTEKKKLENILKYLPE